MSGRTWIPCVGEHNMPDGELFTGPVEDSVEGEVAFSFPTTYAGRRWAGWCCASRAAGWWTPSAQQGEAFLHEMLDTDDGARRLGELGIGTNYGIATGTKEILLDEKIGGTVHMAIGMSYPETHGTNRSAVHWDMASLSAAPPAGRSPWTGSSCSATASSSSAETPDRGRPTAGPRRRHRALARRAWH